MGKGKRWSFQFLLTGVFVPFVLVVVLGTGMITLHISEAVSQNSLVSGAQDALGLTCNYIDQRLTQLVSTMIKLQSSAPMNAFVLDLANGGTASSANYIALQEYVSSLYEDEYNALDAVLVYFENHHYRFSQGYYAVSGVNFDWGNQALLEKYTPLKVYWRGGEEQSFLRQIRTQKENTPGFFRIVGTGKTQVRYLMSFDIRTSFFTNSIKELFFTPPDGVAILGKEDTVYSSGRGTDSDQAVFETIRAGEGNGAFRHGNLWVIYDTLRTNGFKMAVFLDNAAVSRQITNMRYFNIVAIVAILLVSAAMSLVFARLMARPLRRLYQQVSAINEKTIETTVVSSGKHAGQELVVLTDSLNMLLERTRVLIHDVENRQNENLLMRYRLLQAQISPHFLYNTLYAIAQECDMGNLSEARTMLYELSAFFRLGLNAGRDDATLEMDRDQVVNYLSLLKRSTLNPIEDTIDILPEHLPLYVPKLTLQPIVENAIKHGLRKKRSASRIAIFSALEGEDLILTIQDDGAGMDEAALAQLNLRLKGHEIPESGFGLYSVNQRIRLRDGEAYGITVSSVPMEGTTVTVRLRARYEQIIEKKDEEHGHSNERMP